MNSKIKYLHPVFIKSFNDDALCVLRALIPKATQRAVKMALFPPAKNMINVSAQKGL